MLRTSPNKFFSLSFLSRSRFSSNIYNSIYSASIDPNNRDEFWRTQMESVHWFKQPTTILDQSNPPFCRWYPDGQLNMSYNCLDRYLPTHSDFPAVYHESPLTGRSNVITYKQFHENVTKFAGVLKSEFGVKKGDRVVIYMSMVPEALYAMHACARLGAMHSVVFGGFSAMELSKRIEDCKPKVIIANSAGKEPKGMIDYKVILDDAVAKTGLDLKKIIVPRDFQDKNTIKMVNGEDYDYYELMKTAQPFLECEVMNSNDPLYLLYTSGTTGMPKGLVRDIGGTAVALSYSMKYIFETTEKETYFAGSDLGWVVGHSFTAYGPLLVGGTTVLFEGKPIGTPDSSAYWRIIQNRKVKGFFTSPTAIRAIRKEDPDGKILRSYDLSSLATFNIAGERCDIHTYRWIESHINGPVINDNYWQTETGWPIVSNFSKKYLESFKPKPGSATKPVPGYNIHILGSDNKPLKRNQLGKIAVKLPTPPSFALTIFNKDETFLKAYFKDAPGYYITGDAGYYDNDDYVHIVTRIDDVINIAGHRLSTGHMEEILLHNPNVVEAAVIGHKDELKGEVPVGFIVIRSGVKIDINEFKKQLVEKVRNDLGPIAVFKYVILVNALPKTRSGKVLRNVLRKMCNGEDYAVPATIEDMTVLDHCEEKIMEAGLGKEARILFNEREREIED